jgi:hypothetical protein
LQRQVGRKRGLAALACIDRLIRLQALTVGFLPPPKQAFKREKSSTCDTPNAELRYPGYGSNHKGTRLVSREGADVKHVKTMTVTRMATLALLASAAAGCASHKHRELAEFTPAAPFSKTFSGSGDTVCWSVKRALLSQGYMLDRTDGSGVLTGSRDYQPQPKLNVTLRLQTTCADNRNGTSIVFVTATREDSALQKMKQSTSVGVGPATLTMPSGSAEVLGVVRRETIKDPNFYNEFFTLVQGYAEQERLAQASGRTHRDDDAPPASSPPPLQQVPPSSQANTPNAASPNQ